MPRATVFPLLAAAVMLTATLQAQVRMGAGIPRAPSVSQPMVGNWGNVQRGVSFSIGSFQRPFHHHFFPQPIFFGEPWFADYFESAPPTPQILVLQQPAPAMVEPREEPRLVTPLLIELQGDRYVRSGGSDQDTGRPGRALSSARSTTAVSDKNPSKASAAELPPAVLVFRDSHREEVNSYAIVGGAIYINSNYWSSGAWTRKVQLADLDLQSTLSLNQVRGVKFVLPAGPNEVVTRP